MTGVTPPVLTLSAGERTLEIDTGELLFPGLVLAFCLFYYWDTRTLPDLSMLYAGPLLYVTTALAVFTLVQQAVSIDGDGAGERDGSDLETASAITDPEPESGPEDEFDSEPDPDSTAGPESGTTATAESGTTSGTESERTAPVASGPTPSEAPVFNVRNAALLVVATAVYILALEPIGFLLATTAYLAFTLSLFGEESLFALALYSIGFAFLLWIVFIQWLQVPL